MGWLLEFDSFVSPNEILTYLNHSGNLDNLDEIKDDLNPFLAFAKARVAVNIIAKSEGFDKSEMIEVLENALSYAKSAVGMEGLTWLVDAWLAEQLKDTTRKITSLEKAQTYVEQIQERQLLLPKV